MYGKNFAPGPYAMFSNELLQPLTFYGEDDAEDPLINQ